MEGLGQYVIVFMECVLLFETLPRTTLCNTVSFNNRFLRTSNTRITSTSVFPVTSSGVVTSKIECCAACDQTNSCMSVHFKETSGLCEMSPLPLVAVSANGAADQEWVTYSKNDWFLVFRGTPGCGSDAYEAWINGVDITTNDVDCMSVNVTSCSKHYRNPIVNSWSTLGVKKVRYALYKAGKEAAYITFDGAGSNITNWFGKSKLLDSSWTDTASHTYNYFSIAGHEPSRRFFINIDYPGCPGDRAYTVIVTKNSFGCNHDNQSTYPQFLYSTNSSYGYPHMMTDFDKADVMAIYIMA